jgi:hypothetical protein
MQAGPGAEARRKNDLNRQDAKNAKVKREGHGLAMEALHFVFLASLASWRFNSRPLR